MKNKGFGKHKLSDFLMSKGFYAVLALCLVGAGSTAWIAADRTLSGLEEQNRQISQQQPQQQIAEEEIKWDLPETPVQKPETRLPKKSSGPALPPSSSSGPSSSRQPSAAPSVPSAPSAAPAAANGSSGQGFTLPVPGKVLTHCSEGRLVRDATMKDWRTHDGVDFAAEEKEDVLAIRSGRVVSVRKDPLWGWTVEIDHGDGFVSTTCGLYEKIPVSEGEQVSGGQVIGRAGGIPAESALPSHIHLELRRTGKAVDPLPLMKQK